jgi:membrane-associated phospholipid phosphatase
MLCIGMSGTALAEDHIFNSTKALKEQVVRVGDEALEVVKTPFDIEGYGMVGTLGVAGAVGLTYIFDQDIRSSLLKNRSDTLKKATDIGSIVGDPYIHIGIAAAVYGIGILGDSPRVKETGEMLGEALLLADATTFLLKESIGRARPYVGNGKASFRPGQFRSDYDSLPSMHTASSFAMASIMAATSESLPAQLLYYSAATFVGFSRAYKDKHWASDILLGAAIGELCGRVVMATHVKGNQVSIAPYASSTSGGVALTGRW